MNVPENLDQFYWKGQNIIIRTERERDAQAKWEEQFDSESRRLLEDETELPISYEAYVKLFTNCESIDYKSDRISLYIENLDGEFVGWININDLDMRHGTFSLGGSIFRQYQRRGYGTEAAAMILDYCFNELRLHKCNNACLAMNEASVKLHQRLGFREEGRMRETVYFQGEYHDRLLYGMTVKEFHQKNIT